MENSESSQKNITDKWLDNIFECLMRLEQYERLMKEGCESILEYVQNPNINLADIQYKNYNLFITEAEILFEDTKHLIAKDKFLNISILLNWIKNYDCDKGGLLKRVDDHIAHEHWNELKPEFSNVIPQVSRLRGLFVSSLWKLLSPSAKENMGGLPQ